MRRVMPSGIFVDVTGFAEADPVVVGAGVFCGVFILYTTPLGAFISTPVGHHLYADDTQLYVSF